MMMIPTRFALIAAALALSSAGALGQGRNRPKNMVPAYDPGTEITLQGTVRKVVETQPKNCPSCGGSMQLSIDADGKTYEVHLGPSTYLEAKAWSFEEGDEVELTGSRVVIGKREVVLARELRRGGAVFILRDQSGAPAWSQRTGK